MAKRKSIPQETFIQKAIRIFRENVGSNFHRANAIRENTVGFVDEKLGSVFSWLFGDKRRTFIWLAVIVYVGLLVWFILEWFEGKVDTAAVQTGFGGLVGSALLGLVISPIIASVIFLILILLNRAFRLITPLVLFIPLVIWTVLYGTFQVTVVLGKLLLLVPFGLLFLVTRGIELWRGIFYTCPSRTCSYRGLPLYVCIKCNTPNRSLWPNLYGSLYHQCHECSHLLPTLDFMGRKDLDRRCGGENCGIPLEGRHAGRVPERLVAIAGGPGSGKTNYLLMAVNQLSGSQNHRLLHGEIDVPRQEEEFRQSWEGISTGRPAAKTAAVANAFLMYTQVGKLRNQVYLYDAPGEEFLSRTAMSRGDYLRLLEGVVLLVDPLSFEALDEAQTGDLSKASELKDVVDSMTMTLRELKPADGAGKVPIRVAVVISKSDLPVVTGTIGDIRDGSIDGGTCREALKAWVGESRLKDFEIHFTEVEYFACSPLGRDVDPGNRQAFEGYGVLEPLYWMLSGRRA